MSEELIHVSRGSITESIHRGDAVVVNTRGEILAYAGNPRKETYIRSAGKPFQAIDVFLSGAVEKFGFNDSEIAIMCASHYGEDFHRAVIDGILAKIGLPMEALHCGSTWSIKPDYARKQAADRVTLVPSNNDCSGKHAGMLASCLMKNYPIADYTMASHPLQKDILRAVAGICRLDVQEIKIGIDGCSVPVHGMPIYNMALGFARLANPAGVEPSVAAACDRIFLAMNRAPEMVAGTDGFCTELIRHTHGKLVGKLGAEGVYCIGVKGRELGIAVKIEDGNYSRALNPAVMRCLEDLNLLTDAELNALESFRNPDILNGLGMTVGTISPCFNLKNLKPVPS